MHFCCICGNLLLIERGGENMRFFCPTCRYTHDISKAYITSAKLKRKKIDEDVFGGEVTSLFFMIGFILYRRGGLAQCWSHRSDMSSVPTQGSLLHANTDAIRRRTHDYILPLCELPGALQGRLARQGTLPFSNRLIPNATTNRIIISVAFIHVLQMVKPWWRWWFRLGF